MVAGGAELGAEDPAGSAFQEAARRFGLAMYGLLLWVAWRRRDLMGGYRYPVWLLGVGVLAWLVTLYLGYNAVLGLRDL